MSTPPEQLLLAVAAAPTATIDNLLGVDNAELRARLSALFMRPSPAVNLHSSSRLWLFGPAGFGKTHALTAVHALCADHPGARALACNVEAFSSALSAGHAVAEAEREAVAVGWAADTAVPSVLLIDDADVIAGDPRLEALLMQLWNEHRGVLLLGSRAHPGALGWRLPDLRSRVLAGELFALAPLRDADRAALLSDRATAVGLTLDADVVAYLLRRLPRDAPQLLVALHRLDLAAWRSQRRLTLPFVRQVLELPP